MPHWADARQISNWPYVTKRGSEGLQQTENNICLSFSSKEQVCAPDTVYHNGTDNEGASHGAMGTSCSDESVVEGCEGLLLANDVLHLGLVIY